MEIIATEKAPAALGPYSQAIRANGMIYCSGQIPINPAAWPGFSRGMGIGGWLYYEIVKGLP